MNETRTTKAAEPDGARRLANLDILRGIAILGILFMNINAMGASALTARWAPVIGWTAINQAAWFARQILADGTARCMLELLFGAGMVILTVYGLAALLAFPLRKLPAQWLIAIGLLYATSITVMGTGEITTIARENLLVAEASEHRVAHQPLSKTEAEAQASTDKWHKKIVEEHKKITAENAERTATPVRWYRAMIGNWTENLGIGWLIYGLGEASATMLIGAGLFKLGITQGSAARGSTRGWRSLPISSAARCVRSGRGRRAFSTTMCRSNGLRARSGD